MVCAVCRIWCGRWWGLDAHGCRAEGRGCDKRGLDMMQCAGVVVVSRQLEAGSARTAPGIAVPAVRHVLCVSGVCTNLSELGAVVR